MHASHLYVSIFVINRFNKAELEQRSDQLLDMSSAFSKTTKTLAQQKRWENIRCRVYLGLAVAVGLLIILIVLLVIFLPSGGDSSKP